MLKSACASFPTWLLNVRDLTHLMSFLSFWKFFPESLSCLLMCHLTEQEWGSWCTWTLALWARESAPVCQKCPLLSPSLHAGPARSCPHRDQLASECSRQEVGGAVRVRGDHDDWNGSWSLHSYFYNCPLLLFSTVLTLPTRTALYRPAHLLGRENWGMEVSRLSWAQWAMELSRQWQVISSTRRNSLHFCTPPPHQLCLTEPHFTSATAVLVVISLLTVFFPRSNKPRIISSHYFIYT